MPHLRQFGIRKKFSDFGPKIFGEILFGKKKRFSELKKMFEIHIWAQFLKSFPTRILLSKSHRDEKNLCKEFRILKNGTHKAAINIPHKRSKLYSTENVN